MSVVQTLRRRALATCAATTFTLAAAGTSSYAQEVEKVRWPVPISFASTLTALGDTLPWVAEQLDKMSAGNIKLEVFEPGTMVPALGIFEAVSTGNVEAGYAWMGYEIGQVPASALFGATPFGLESQEFMAWMYEGGGKALLEEVYKPHNVHPIFCGTISPEAAGWFKFPIERLDQVKGLKVRAAGLGGEIFSQLGANVTVLPAGELYQALETGVLDATEFSLPTVDEQLGFGQVAKFYHLPGWHQPSTNQYLYINLDVWNGLQPQTQAIIDTACTAGVARALARAEALQGPVLSKFLESGITAVKLPEEILQALRDATATVMERKSAENEMFGRVYKSMMDFQKAHKPWKELGYLPRDWKWAKEPAAQ